MANEFVARKGIISLDSIQVTGSISATGGITISGSISSASYASNAELLDGRDSTIFATTGSNIFSGNQTICANLTTTCTITAQTLVVQTVTSSIVYSSGSNIFGNQLTDTQRFTGSMFITGSTLNVAGGTICTTGNTCFGGMSIVNSCIGVGVSSPLGKAHIKIGNTGATPNAAGNALVVEDIENGISILSSTAGAGYLIFGDSGNNTAGQIIYDHSADAMRLFTSGSEKIRITSGGNVGIGIISPNASLHVNCTVEANGSLYRAVFGGTAQNANMTGLSGGNGSEVQIQAGSSTRGAYLTLGGGMGASEAMGGVAFYNSNNTDGKRLRAYLVGGQEGATANEQGGYLTFGTAANASTTPTERMRLDSCGNLGVNYTPCKSYGPLQVKSPASSYTIDLVGRTSGVNGESQITFWNSAQTVVQGAIGNIARCMIFYAGGTEVMRMTCGGEVLIGSTGIYGGGTTNESKLLVVGAPPSADTDRGLISFMDNRAYNTATLGAKVMMGGAYNNAGAITFFAGLAGLKENTTDGNYAGALAFYTRANGAASTERMRITSGGSVCIGSAAVSGEILRVNGCSCLDNYISVYSGTIQVFLDADKTFGGGIVGTQSGHPLFLRTSGTNKLSISTAGVLDFPGSNSTATSISDTLSLGVSSTSYAWIQSWGGRPLRINEQGNNVNAYGTNGYGLVNTTASDLRIKKNVETIENALDKVSCLRGVYYEFDDNNCMCMKVPGGKRRVGLIAQEVEQILPEAVLDSQDCSVPLSLDYGGMIGLLTKAIQEQQCKIKTLESCLGIN